MSDYPIQIEKVQPPPLRDDILARDRLLDWLNVKIHNRVVLLTAEAGYGKTTLLADFARRTRLRVLWFRLDRGDRDWVGFIAHLLAAVRVHQPDFGPATGSLLRETGSSAPPLELVLDTFLRELGELGSEPAALIFDDFHLVDDSEDVRSIVNELLVRGPERLTLVIASRLNPSVRLARLRSLGEVMELGTSDLRFDSSETELLLGGHRELRLDTDLVVELAKRTEGWAASLQLVRAALRDRDRVAIRQFITSLSGAEGHLYDYLAEEVIGELSPALQDFLMRTSILSTVDLRLGAVAGGGSLAETRQLIDEARRVGLLGRLTPADQYQTRAHPLVREFLQARLLRRIGARAVAALHWQVAEAAESEDWSRAAHHYLTAGDQSAARRVVDGSLLGILATGAFRVADDVLRQTSTDEAPDPAALVIWSRLAQQQGNVDLAVSLAERALVEDPTSAAVISTVMAARSLGGDVAGAVDMTHLLELAPGENSEALASAYRAAVESSVDGSIDIALRELRGLAERFPGGTNPRYRGITLANESLVLKARGDAQGALKVADEAIASLAVTSAYVDQVSARLARAWALAHLGDLAAAREEVGLASAVAPPGQFVEVAGEAAEMEFYYGDAARSRALLSAVGEPTGDGKDQALLIRASLDARDGATDSALAEVSAIESGTLRMTVAFEARRQVTRALIAWGAGGSEAVRLAREARDYASAQGADLWARYAGILAACAGHGDPSDEVRRVGSADAAVISMAAELVAMRIADLAADARRIVESEAAMRPERWREALRRAIRSSSDANRSEAGAILSQIGTQADVILLRDRGRRQRNVQLASQSRNLARRLAARVEVEDLGRVRLRVGSDAFDASRVRRKVLALLCFLLTKVDYAASREEVTDNLWPDLDPADALNSLNQTVYFLRRVFEPNYLDSLSPGYVHQDGETIWLDNELIGSRSDRVRRLIQALSAEPSVAEAKALLDLYLAPFALDFAYEEWAARFRDPLHASVLRVVEHAIKAAADQVRFAEGIGLAERAVQLDPDAEEIQVALIHFYRMTGAHAAAAEQYERYAQSMRGLGVDPRPLADLTASG